MVTYCFYKASSSKLHHFHVNAASHINLTNNWFQYVIRQASKQASKHHLSPKYQKLAFCTCFEFTLAWFCGINSLISDFCFLDSHQEDTWVTTRIGPWSVIKWSASLYNVSCADTRRLYTTRAQRGLCSHASSLYIAGCKVWKGFWVGVWLMAKYDLNGFP